MQLDLSQQFLNCDDVKGDFDKDKEIGDNICGMTMLKQNMREKLEESAETPEGAEETAEELRVNSSCKAEVKFIVQKRTKHTK